MSLEIKDPAPSEAATGSKMFKAPCLNDPISTTKASIAQEQTSDPAAVKRARRALLLGSVYEQMQAVHHQADLVMLFAETDDQRGINRQLTFLVEAVQRAVQSSADLSALKSDGAA